MTKRIVEIVDYDPGWPAAFALEKAQLLSALSPMAIQVFHIGSTAVPGLAAKPIIDLMIEVPDLAELDARTPELLALGYVAKGENGIAGRRYFHKGGVQRSHHLHAYRSGDANLIRQLAFRDYLRHHAELAAAYARLKRGLAATFRNDTMAYQRGKEDFLQKHVQDALAWYAHH
jgi:GrpB-like predicted nucleotidyltransferase (UPF0157 family)